MSEHRRIKRPLLKLAFFWALFMAYWFWLVISCQRGADCG